MADALPQHHLQILQHALGVDQHGRGQQYRNHYVADGADAEHCRELAAQGFMVEGAPSPLTGGMPLFQVTAEGKRAVAEQSPAPPRLTRGQRRYRRWLDGADAHGLDFGEWLIIFGRHPA